MSKAVLSKVTTVLISDSTVFKGFYIVRVGIIVENKRSHKLAPFIRQNPGQLVKWRFFANSPGLIQREGQRHAGAQSLSAPTTVVSPNCFSSIMELHPLLASAAIRGAE